MNGTGAEEELPVLKCWGCGGQESRCGKCDGTGAVFWVHGYAYPYTPAGEKIAAEHLRRRRRP